MDTLAASNLFQTSHLNYIRNSRAIAVLWCVFTVCFSIINIVVFLQPWLGDTEETTREGYFGLFESCKYTSNGNKNVNFNIEYEKDILARVTAPPGAASIPSFVQSYKLTCEGSWSNIATSVNPSATFFIGFSALINLVCIACFLVLFLFINPEFVFTLCGVLQLISSKSSTLHSLIKLQTFFLF